jgi:hypothetical protein
MNLFVQLYGDIDDLCNSRILTELDYYMYEVKNKIEMIYYFTKEQSIFLCFPSDTNWNMEKLQVLCRTALRENTFLMLLLDSYTGYMDKNVWNNIKNESVKFFKDPKSYRISMGRGNKLTKILNTIKRNIIKVK